MREGPIPSGVAAIGPRWRDTLFTRGPQARRITLPDAGVRSGGYHSYIQFTVPRITRAATFGARCELTPAHSLGEDRFDPCFVGKCSIH